MGRILRNVEFDTYADHRTDLDENDLVGSDGLIESETVDENGEPPAKYRGFTILTESSE